MTDDVGVSERSTRDGQRVAAGQFVPMRPAVAGETPEYTIRCIVCGQDAPMVSAAASRDFRDGSLKPGDPDKAHDDPRRPRFADGAVAGACAEHDPEVVRTAWVVTYRGLRDGDGNPIRWEGTDG